MTKEQLLRKRIRSMEVEGANFQEMEKIMLDRLRERRGQKKA